jgi:hypothetical protein
MRWELMDKYLAGECTSAELVEMERWLDKAPRVRLFLEQLAGPPDAELTEAKASIWARLQDQVSLGSRPTGP